MICYCLKEIKWLKEIVVEMIRSKKVVWLVTESKINYVEDKREWTGTKIIFEITKKSNKPDSPDSYRDRTQLRFTHLGLVPEMECFESCSNSWRQLIQQGLFSLIKTGKGAKILLG